MAVWGGYPQTVNYSTVNIAKGGGSENLLINPRGKVNQLSEAQGVIAAGQYFCDGWKAGAAGAEVYVDDDGFRLISGSIVQLVTNTIEVGRNLRSSMDVISGAPVMSINGGTSNEPNGAGAYIQFEISGDNSKFTRIILAESVDMPIYQQMSDELTPCYKFLEVQVVTVSAMTQWKDAAPYTGNAALNIKSTLKMCKVPAATFTMGLGTSFVSLLKATESGVLIAVGHGGAPSTAKLEGYVLDARP